MLRKILPFLLGILPVSALADTYIFGMPAGVGTPANVGNITVSAPADPITYNYSASTYGNLFVNGAFNVSGTPSGPVVISTGGSFNTLFKDTVNNGNLTNDFFAGPGLSGLTVNATGGINVAYAGGSGGLIGNTLGTMTLNPGAGYTVNAGAVVSGDPTYATSGGQILITSGGGLILAGMNANELNAYLAGIGVSVTPPLAGYYGIYSQGGIYVGTASSPAGGTNGDIIFTNPTNKSAVVQSDGDIVLGANPNGVHTGVAAGTVNVASGYALSVGTKMDGAPISIAIGDPTNNPNNATPTIANAGTLSIGGATDTVQSIAINGNVDSVGTATAPASLSMTAVGGDITFGNATNRAYSTFSATASNNLTFNSFDNFDTTSGSATLIAQNGAIAATTGQIANHATGTGTQMLVSAKTTVTAAGNLDNSGYLMNVLAPGGVTVGGTMKNDMIGGTLNIGNAGAPVASLTVNGGGTSTDPSSFQNKGAFAGYVTGASTFAYGIDNSTAPATGSFFLKTGTLNFTNDPTGAIMNNFMQNALNSFTLNITNGNLTTLSMTNGVNGGGTLSNPNANMTVTAQHVIVTNDVRNIGATMNVYSTATGAMTIGGGVYNGIGGTTTNTASVMNLDTPGTMTITGSVANMGRLSVDGETALTISGSVYNFGKAEILSLNNTVGKITIAGDVTNAGGSASAGPCTNINDCNLFINARGLTINGTLSNQTGNTHVLASDNSGANIVIGGLTTGGGWMGIDILTGLNVTNGITMNGGTLAMTAADDINIGTDILNNRGTLTAVVQDAFNFANGTINTGLGSRTIIDANSITGKSITNAGIFAATAPQFVTLTNGGITNYGTMTVNTSVLTITTGGISSDGKLVISSGPFMLTGGVANMPVLTATNPNNWYPWLNVNVAGDVTGGVQFVGLGNMTIGGNYEFDNSSAIHAAVLPASYGSIPGRNYYATVVPDPNGTDFGKIVNVDAYGHPTSAIINVGGTFYSDLSFPTPTPVPGATIGAGEVGVSIFDILNPSDAIWLIHADGGVAEDGFGKMRNVAVQFCNLDGTKCFNYLTTMRDQSGLLLNSSNPADLPAFLSVRDSNDDGIMDSVYIVFDPAFGPAGIFKIQPIVNREPTHTKSEWQSAGAIDDMVAGGVAKAKFSANSPIEAIPVALAGTNLSSMANELYARMNQYITDGKTDYLTQFSRLFKPRELNMMASQMTMAEHENNSEFERRMMDESQWNRNRNLTKFWGDFTYSMYAEKETDQNVKGTRFNFTGGIDVQRGKNDIFGLMAHAGRTTGKDSDSMNLNFGSCVEPAGFVDLTVSGTTVGAGAYLLHRITDNARFYVNAMLNADLFDIARRQTYVDPISGTGTSFNITSEWGLVHNLWLDYISGNLYARFGYNFGLNATTKSAGSDYMKYHGDGYFILTPGYILSLHKKVYLTPWLVMNPHIGAGVEYDLGGFDSMYYKFAIADKLTKYDVDMSPLWAMGRAGVDFTGVSGWSIGAEYEYKYNNVIKMNTFRLYGSYRF